MAAMSSSRSDFRPLHFRQAHRIRFQLLLSDPTGTKRLPTTCSFDLVRESSGVPQYGHVTFRSGRPRSSGSEMLVAGKAVLSEA